MCAVAGASNGVCLGSSKILSISSCRRRASATYDCASERSTPEVGDLAVLFVDRLQIQLGVLCGCHVVTGVWIVPIEIVAIEDTQPHGRLNRPDDVILRSLSVEAAVTVPDKRPFFEADLCERRKQRVDKFLEPRGTPRDCTRRRSYEPLAEIEVDGERQRRKEADMWMLRHPLSITRPSPR